MNEIELFESPEFGALRTFEKDGEPWFVAVDVCRSLGIGNASQAVSRLDEDERDTVISNDTPLISNDTPLNVISESGLYTLVLSSRKKEAKAFKRWITHEVLPAIRKTGRYSSEKEAPSDYEMILAIACHKLKDRVETLEKLLEIEKQRHSLLEELIRQDKEGLA